jgi:hypothetical protein
MYKIRHSGRDARIQSQGRVQFNAILGTGFQTHEFGLQKINDYLSNCFSQALLVKQTFKQNGA